MLRRTSTGGRSSPLWKGWVGCSGGRSKEKEFDKKKDWCVTNGWWASMTDLFAGNKKEYSQRFQRFQVPGKKSAIRKRLGMKSKAHAVICCVCFILSSGFPCRHKTGEIGVHSQPEPGVCFSCVPSFPPSLSLFVAVINFILPFLLGLMVTIFYIVLCSDAVQPTRGSEPAAYDAAGAQ